LAVSLQPVLSFQEGAEAGTILEDGGGEMQLDALGCQNALRQVQTQAGVGRGNLDIDRCAVDLNFAEGQRH